MRSSGPDIHAAVFDAWDAMAAAAGLPGPVARDPDRRFAIDRQLAAHGRFRVIEAVAAVGRSDFLRGRNRKPGQGDWRADFDYVFEVSGKAVMRTFRRLLEGGFTPEPVPIGPAAAAPPVPRRDEPDDVAAFRAALRLPAATQRSWTDGLVFEPDGDTLTVRAPNGFVADYVTANLLGALEAAARSIWPGVSHVRAVHQPACILERTPP